MTSGTADFEQAISLTGYGKFHYLLAICCALCMLATGFQNGLNAYILPVAQCDLNMTSAQMGYLNASFLIGGICSAFLWGLLGDLIGRRKVLCFTLLTNWLTTICAGLSQSFLMLIIFRFLNGFLIGAPGTLTFSYFAEFQPEHMKTKAVCFVGSFFTAAWLLLPALSWIIIPLPWEFRYMDFVFNSWRLFIIAISVPSLLAGLWLLSLPESPKFLLSRGESKQALTILKTMFSVNSGEPADNFQVALLVDNAKLQNVVNNSRNNATTVGRSRTVRLLKEAQQQLKCLFQPPLIFYTLLTSALMFANMFGYLGLGLWLPEILSRFDEYTNSYPNEDITLCELQSLYQSVNDINATLTSEVNATMYLSNETNIHRCGNEMDETVFINTLIIGACCLAGNFLAMCMSGMFNRRVLPVVTLLIGGISAASIYWLNSSIQHLFMGSLFQTSMATSNIVLSGVVVDIFPTTVSAMAVCTAILAGRLGAVVSNLVLGFLLDKSCEIPLFVVVITLLVGAALGFLLPVDRKPETKEIKSTEIYKSLPDISVISTT